MNTCLVTILPGKVSDTSMLKVDDIRFHIVLNEGENSGFTIQAVSGKKVTASIANVVKGSPKFSDGSMTIENNSEYPKPTYSTAPATELQEFDIIVSNKSYLRYLDMPTRTNEAFDVGVLKSCTALDTLCLNGDLRGDSSVLRDKTSFKNLFVRGAGFRLDLNDLKDCPLVTLELKSENGADAKFSINDLQNMTTRSLKELTLAGTYQKQLRGVTGDLSVLSSFKDLVKLAIPYTSISGNLSALSGLTGLEEISASECNFEGDLSSLPPKCRIFSNIAGSKNTWFTWTDGARALKSSCLLSINAVNYPANLLGSDLFEMLNDQSCCFPPEKKILNEAGAVIDHEDLPTKIYINTDDNHQQFLEECSGDLEILLSDLLRCCVTELVIDGETFITNGQIVYAG